MTAAVTGLLCWRDSRLPHRNPRPARYFVCCGRRRSIACAICSCSVTGRGGDPKNVRERPGPEQDGSRLVQIHVHVACGGRVQEYSTLARSSADLRRVRGLRLSPDWRRAAPLRTCLTFFVAEGRLPSCQSTPLARRVRANRPPPLRMRSLWTGSLLAPRDFLRRPPSVGTCPPVMTYTANPGRTRPFHFSLVRRQEKAPTGPGLQGNDQQSPARRHRGGSENLRCALSALPSIRFRLIYGSREGAYSRNTSPLQRVHHPSRSNVAEPLNNKQKPAGTR